MLSRDEFYEKFPHVHDLPIQPQCNHCWKIFELNVQPSIAENDLDVISMQEYHTKSCPMFYRDHQTYLVDKRKTYQT